MVNTNSVVENKTNINTTVNPKTPERDFQYFLSDILTDRNCIIIYSSLVLFTMVITVSRSIAFFRYCMTASTRLHNKMFDRMVYATMRFFNTNPQGRILNRFSKDIGAVDETLPITIVDTIQVSSIYSFRFTWTFTYVNVYVNDDFYLSMLNLFK